MTYPMAKAVFAKVLCLLCVFPAAAQQPAKALSEYEVVAHLASRDFGQMSEALGTIKLSDNHPGFSPWRLAAGSDVGASVRAALIESLTYHLSQSGAWSDGKPHNAAYVDQIPDGWGADLTIRVIALRDEASIPVLLAATGYGWGPIDALLDFGPMVVSPAIDCAENDAGWTESVDGCMLLLTAAAYLWRNELRPSEIERMQALVRTRLSRPIADYMREQTSIMYAHGAAELALAIGWTEATRALARARLQEMAPENFDRNREAMYSWRREAIRKSLSGEIASRSVAELLRSADQ